MMPEITLTSQEQELDNLVVVVSRLSKLPGGLFSSAEKRYIKLQTEERKQDVVSFNRLDYQIFVCILRDEKDRMKRFEKCRNNGDKVAAALNAAKAARVAIFDAEGFPGEVLALAEGMALGSYQFLKYRSSNREANTLEFIEIYSAAMRDAEYGMRDAGCGMRDVQDLTSLVNAVNLCRDLINEPVSHLNATSFAAKVERIGRSCDAYVEILTKSKIEALKMGGLIGVNQGSAEPPTFTVMEWRPDDAVNAKPYVLVGKGVMYDTGGMNLKPGDSMLNMKDDMSGAAAVVSTIYAIAQAKLPVHVIGLATLTGASVRAIGKFGAVAMQSGAAAELEMLKKSGEEVYERLVEFPMWDEYGDLIKSDVADLKNLGPGEAGMITAAKFLENFTDYPYIHLDIAGPAFIEKRDSYRGQGGTGFGVRLLFDFLSKISSKK